MGVELSKWLLCVIFLLALCRNGAHAQPQVPCYFIFGDSLVDNGNNNQITSLAKANYRPYGIDYPQGPTGRFSNGLTTVDVIGKCSRALSQVLMHIVYVPLGSETLKGHLFQEVLCMYKN